MSVSSAGYAGRRASGLAKLADCVVLAKPKIAMLSLLTVVVGAFVAAGSTPPAIVLLHTLVGTAVLAASASALNQFLERRSDALMPRTADRPLASGRLRPQEVLAVGLAAGLAAVVYLALFAGWTTAMWALAAWALYVWVYTPLKRRTTLNTVVGAVAGALPVLIGYSAAGGYIGIEAATLFLVVYLWQFPHFMAIAWLYRDEYAAAGLRMLPAVEPSGQGAAWQAIASSLALLAVSLVPWLWMWGGAAYVVPAIALGVAYVAASFQFLGRRNDRAARRLLRVSLVYLPAWLALLIVVRFI